MSEPAPAPAAAVVFPTAVVDADVRLGPGTSVWFHATIRAPGGPVTIGAGTNVQDHAVVAWTDGPVSIGVGVTIGHRAQVAAAVIGDHSLVGNSAVLAPGVRLPEWTFVAVGARVEPGLRPVPGMFVTGNPARVLRPINDVERTFLRSAALHYTALSGLYPPFVTPDHQGDTAPCPALSSHWP